MIPKEQREKWRKLAVETTIVSALGGYTPEEFITLLDAVDEYENKLIAFAQKVREKSEKFYKEWEFCQKHNFELEAKYQRGISDEIARIVTDMEYQFGFEIEY